MKNSEVIKLSDAELHEELEKQTGAYDQLKWTHAVAPLENPAQLKDLRRSIARLKTELTKRENK